MDGPFTSEHRWLPIQRRLKLYSRRHYTMELLEYPIEYHKPVEGEKLIVFCIVCFAVIGLVLSWARRKGGMFTAMVPSIRH